MDWNPLRFTAISVCQNTPLKESSEYSKHRTLEQAGKQKHLLKPTEALPWNTQNREEPSKISQESPFKKLIYGCHLVGGFQLNPWKTWPRVN